MSETKKNQVFISYAHENLETVKNIVAGLKKRKLHVWFDKEHLAPGRWKTQIIKEIARSRYFVICISDAALRKTGNKPGFQDNELHTAYEIAQAQPDQEFTIVPIRLEDCDRGDFRITSFQQYDLFSDFERGLDQLAVHLGGISLLDVRAQDERSKDEKIIESLFGKSLSAFYAKDFKKMSTIINSVIAMYPDNIQARLNKGVSLYVTGRIEEALQVFSKILEIDPENATAWFGKGLSTFALGRHEEALTLLNEALELNPKDERFWQVKGGVLSVLSRNEEALQAHNKAIELNPKWAEGWRGKSVALLQLGLSEESTIAFRKFEELNKAPEYPTKKTSSWI